MNKIKHIFLLLPIVIYFAACASYELANVPMSDGVHSLEISSVTMEVGNVGPKIYYSGAECCPTWCWAMR